MAVYEVERLIRDVHRLGRFPEFDADRAAFCAGYDLTAAEQTAVIGGDVGSLYAMGVHPMATLFFGQASSMPMASYLEQIGAAPERVAELRGLFASAQSAARPQPSVPGRTAVDDDHLPGDEP
jgi:hypothetical protein